MAMGHWIIQDTVVAHLARWKRGSFGCCAGNFLHVSWDFRCYRRALNFVGVDQATSSSNDCWLRLALGVHLIFGKHRGQLHSVLALPRRIVILFNQLNLQCTTNPVPSSYVVLFTTKDVVIAIKDASSSHEESNLDRRTLRSATVNHPLASPWSSPKFLSYVPVRRNQQLFQLHCNGSTVQCLVLFQRVC